MNPNPGSAAERSANIFVNYRREDSAGHAGRLFDRLSGRFPGRVFMDIDTLEPGVDFVEVIEHAVGSCEVLIVLIGHEWLRIKDGAGHRRLDDPEDFVRLEVATALQRKIRVIPVLVQGAPMPRPEELPPDLAKLARRNAIELSDGRWAYDVDRLIHTIGEVLKGLEPVPQVPQVPPIPVPAELPQLAPPVPAARRRAAPSKAWIAALLTAVVLTGAGWTGWKTLRPQEKPRVTPTKVTVAASAPIPAPPVRVSVPAPAPPPAPVPPPESDKRPVEVKQIAIPAPAPESEKPRVSTKSLSVPAVEDSRKSEKRRVRPKHHDDDDPISLGVDVSSSSSVSVPAPAPIPAAAPTPVPVPAEQPQKAQPANNAAPQGAGNPSRWKSIGTKLGHALGHRPSAPPAPVPPG
jgi:hypothetical protein